MYYIKREEWLKKSITERIKNVNIKPIVIIHHTATPKKEYQGDINYLDRIHREKGFIMIGYHFIIAPDGKVFEGRKINEEGAHTKRFNSFLGIALIGNFEEEEMEKRQLFSLLNFMSYLEKIFFINKFSFHFMLNEKTLCGKKIFDKLVKNRNKRVFKFPDDLFYNLIGSNPFTEDFSKRRD
ncbi:MAG: N-acetylmuramoyl-L-alanine amidase [Candidatus Hydrothermales bacterium]